jgi:ABC-type glycerol-3-phosphate transport system substrate-binding protein
MKKRNLLTLLLIAALISASCGSAGGSADTTASSADTTAAVTEAPKEISGVPDGIDLGGETYTMFNAPQYKAFNHLNHVEEETGDTIDDAVYRRNLNVQEKLNFKLAFIDDDAETDHTFIRTQVLAGDNTFDFAIGTQWQIVQLVTEGLFVDLMDAPYIDITKPWWAENYIETINMGNQLRFFLSGDISLEFLRDLGAGFYNKTVYANYHGDGDGLFDIILDGKWTFDKMGELIKGAYRDLNGDNVRDKDDAYGFRQIRNIFSEHAFYAAGAHTCTIGKDGYPELDPVSEKTIAIAEKIHSLYYNNEGSFLYAECTTTETEQIMPEKFAADQTMFYWGLLYYSDYLREMKSDYGVIPYPKYEESDEYRSMVHDGAPIVCIPVTASDRLDGTCAIIEELAYQSRELCTPAYFDVVLKGKYARDGGESAEILDMIRASAFTEVGMVYNYAMNESGLMIRKMILDDQPNITTVYAPLESAAKEKLADLIEAYGAME